MMNITNKIVHIFGKKMRSPEEVARETEIRNAIRELKLYSDRDLRDIGIARSRIEHVVRYGKGANDPEVNQDSAA